MKRKLLFAAFALILGWSNAMANQTLADNGVYYIQNVETGLFLSRGGSYGAHALVDNYGLAWRLSGTNGSITLQMYDIYCEGYTSGGLGDNSYVDNGSPLTNWTLTGDANGYTIKTGSTYLTATGNTTGSDVVIDGDGTGNKTWVLLSDAEHAAVLAAKTSAQESAIATTASIDLGGSTLSAILGNTSNWRTSTIAVAAPTSSGVWTYTENRDQGGANNYGDYGTELYNKSGKFTKTISGLENGIYKLTVRSMHRSTHNAPTWTVGESFTNHTNSYVLANGYYAQLKDWKSAAEKNGNNYNPNGTGEFKTKVEAGNYATDIYTYVSDGTLDITVSQEGFWYGEWFAFNGVTLTYYTDQVTDEDATAILATATALEAQEMDADILSALSSAKSTFNSSRTIANYNALQTAIDNAQESADAYAKANATLAVMKATIDGTNVYTSAAYTTYNSSYTSYKGKYDARSLTNEEAATLYNDVLPLTRVDNSGWHKANTTDDFLLSAWSVNGEQCADFDKALYINTWSTEGDSDGSGFQTPFFEYWTSAASLDAKNLSATVTGLTANTVYDVSALVRVSGNSKVAGSITLTVNGGAPVDVTAGDAIGTTGRYMKTFTATGVTDASGNLEISFDVAANSNISWFSFKDVKYAVGEAETTNDYTALNTAIEAAEANIGFETGEYAPYNNVDAIEALTEAKAIDQSKYSISSYVSAVTSALNGATWTANVEEANAVYDGTFAAATNNGAPAGWTMSNNTLGGDFHSRAFVGDSRLSEFNKTNSAFFQRYDGTNSNRGSQYYYGNTAGYTMPLKAATTYRVTVDFTNWGTTDSKPLTLNVDGPSSFNANQTKYSTKNADSGTDSPDQFDIIFTTTVAGNYTLRFQVQGPDDNAHNVVVSNIELKKMPAQSVTITAAGFATFNSDYALDLDNMEGGSAFIVGAGAADAVDGYITLTTQEGTVAANTGLILKSTGGTTGTITIPVVASGTDISSTNKLVAVTENGTGVAINDYILGCDNEYKNVGLYKLDEATTLDKGQAYLPADFNNAKALRFVLPGETPTKVVAPEVADVEEEEVLYNMAGVRVDKNFKGFVVNQKGEKRFNK